MAHTTSEGILSKYKVLLAMISLVLCVQNIYSIFSDVMAKMADNICTEEALVWPQWCNVGIVS